MGRMKEIWMENEQAINVLSFLEQKLNTDSHCFIGSNPRIARILNLIGEIVFSLSKSPTYNRPLLDTINVDINEKAKQLSEALEKKNNNNDLKSNLEWSMLFLDLEALLLKCRGELKNKEEKDNLNSTEFYTKRLNELEDNVKKLESEKEQNSQRNKQKDEEIKRLLVIIKETEKQLEEKKRQEDAQRNWNEKIEEAFKKLNEYQTPLIQEKERLKALFWIFGVLSVISVIALSIAVYLACHMIYTSDEILTFATYIPYYSPIPIIGILLWVFIVQMNREQRQLIILTQHLHNLSYTEGLLKSINIFAPGIEDAVNRINSTVDKLLDNHLSLHPALILKEESLSRSEKNQSTSIGEMTSLLKEIRELVK
jgi:hypothetical protein